MNSKTKPFSSIPLEKISRESYEPAYVQLSNILQRQMAAGIYSPGDQLPSEAELRRGYEVSQMTVRRAINLLSDLQMISTVQGKGSFVKRLDLGNAVFRSTEIKNLFSSSRATSVELLGAHIVAANEKIAGKLALGQGEQTIYIKRLILVDEKPAFYHRAYLVYDPYQPIVEAEMEATFLQGLFNGSESKILKRGELKIEAVTMDAEEARALQKPHPTAAFSLEHIFVDFEENPVSWGWFICANDCLRLTTSVGIGKDL